jgi:hypothetical protein
MTLRNLLKIEKDLWLDRYHVSRRKDIKELREKMIELNDELGQVRDKRDKLGRTRDGKDALEVFRGVVDYFERVTAKSSPNSKQESSEAMQVGETEVALPEDQDKDKDNDGDDRDKVERKERQERLKLSYRAILEKMESKLEEYQTRLDQLEHETSTMFSTDSWRTLGPYHLSSLVFRTGLNGRGSTWSAVTGDDGKWYKIVDLSKEEIEIDEVLNDRSGLFLDAGITLAFYQKAGVEEFERQVPETLSVSRERRLLSLPNIRIADVLLLLASPESYRKRQSRIWIDFTSLRGNSRIDRFLESTSSKFFTSSSSATTYSTH